MNTPFIAVALLLVVVIAVWKRFHKAAGLRRMHLVTLVPAIVIAVAAVVLSWNSLLREGDGMTVIACAGFLAVGVAAAWYCFRKTRFEQRADGVYFQPYRPIGIALFVILLIQLAVKAVLVYVAISPHASEIQQAYARLPIEQRYDPQALGDVLAHTPALATLHHFFDPVTSVIVALLAGYYGWYYVRVILRARVVHAGPKWQLFWNLRPEDNAKNRLKQRLKGRK